MYKARQKGDFDIHHEVTELSDLDGNTNVWVTTDTDTIPGRIAPSAGTLMFFIIQTLAGEIRRNRSQLRVVPECDSSTEGMSTLQPISQERSSNVIIRSHTVTAAKSPERLQLKKGDVV